MLVSVLLEMLKRKKEFFKKGDLAKLKGTSVEQKQGTQGEARKGGTGAELGVEPTDDTRCMYGFTPMHCNLICNDGILIKSE